MQEITTPQLSDQELRERVDHLADWLRRIRRERRRAILKRVVGLIIMATIVSRFLGSNSGFFPFFLVAMGGGGAILGVGLLNPLREATRAVIALEDVRTIEVLLQARHAPDAVTRGEATAQVTELLPKLRADDRNWLTAASVREITSFLNWLGPSITKLAALRALEFVGDSSSLPVIAMYAEDLEVPTEGEMQPEARRIYPILKARIEAEAAAAKLLRPAEATSGQDLLRPAATSGEDAPDHLLRPVPEERHPHDSRFG